MIEIQFASYRQLVANVMEFIKLNNKYKRKAASKFQVLFFFLSLFVFIQGSEIKLLIKINHENGNNFRVAH